MIVCKDGESDKRKRGGGKAPKASGNGSRASPDRGVAHVDRRKLKDEMLLDLQKKQDMCYQLLLKVVAEKLAPGTAPATLGSS